MEQLMTTISQFPATTSSATLGGILAVLIISLKVMWIYIKSSNSLNISASIAGLYRGNVIEINAGENEHVKSGLIFTVYKRLQIRDISDAQQGHKRQRFYYKPVAQLKVISTTEKNSLCKYRPIRGYSANPSVGDTAFYSSKFIPGKIIPFPTC